MATIENAFERFDNFARFSHVESIIIKEATVANITVTIAIPTFKRVDLLKEAIDSALGQTNYTDYQVIVVDNNPERDCQTERLIKTYSDERLGYYKNAENTGLFGNWNRCFELSKGKYTVLLHDDDFLFPHFLSESMRILSNHNDIGIFKPTMISWHVDGNPFEISKCRPVRYPFAKFMRLEAKDYIYMGNYMEAPTGCIFDRELFLSTGGFNNDLFPNADTLSMLYIATLSKVVLYRRALGVKRLFNNESLKIDTLNKFVISRYNTTKYLIDRYGMGKNYGVAYLTYITKKFCGNLCEISPNFKFDFKQVGTVEPTPSQAKNYGRKIKRYKISKVIGAWLRGI